jgi:hypothetical protein
MNDVASPLVLVADPNDETLGFSGVCAEAEVVHGLQHFGWQQPYPCRFYRGLSPLMVVSAPSRGDDLEAASDSGKQRDHA